MPTHYQQTLYAINKKGETKVWSIQVDGNSKKAILTIVTEAKEGASPVVRNETISEGKNIGRANETTALEQAILEAKARVAEKINKKGYVDSKSKIGSHLVNNFGLPIPMTAKDSDEVKIHAGLMIYIQPKLNGHRAMYDGKSNTFYSRGGEAITSMAHIQTVLNSIPKRENIILDGELYSHGIPLQTQSSWIRKYHPGDSEKIKYNVYDIIISEDFGMTQEKRLDYLGKFFSKYKLFFKELIVPVDTGYINESGISNQVDKYIKLGYEGGIVRLPSGKYEPGHRSRSLIKQKRFKDAEWLVKDIYEGASIKINGQDQTATCILCTGACGDFEVTAPGTRETQREILKNKKNYIGKMLTIKYYDTTKDGKPFHPVALQFREDI